MIPTKKVIITIKPGVMYNAQPTDHLSIHLHWRLRRAKQTDLSSTEIQLQTIAKAAERTGTWSTPRINVLMMNAMIWLLTNGMLKEIRADLKRQIEIRSLPPNFPEESTAGTIHAKYDQKCSEDIGLKRSRPGIDFSESLTTPTSSSTGITTESCSSKCNSVRLTSWEFDVQPAMKLSFWRRTGVACS